MKRYNWLFIIASLIGPIVVWGYILIWILQQRADEVIEGIFISAGIAALFLATGAARAEEELLYPGGQKPIKGLS